MSFVIRRVRGRLELAEELGRTAMMQHVAGNRLLIGRRAGADLRCEGAAVALEHARLERREGGRLELTDLGSLTGTYLNGRRVERAAIVDRDWIEIGRHRLTVVIEAADAPVVLFVEELAGERSAAAAEASPGVDSAPLPPPVDALRAYGLRRAWLGPGRLAVAAATLVGAALAALAWTGGTHYFRPGPVSAAHAPLADDCAACHTPWRGPDDARCVSCHAGPQHQPAQAFDPACSSCHLEHRSRPRLAAVEDRSCIQCHAELRLAGDGEPRFARRVTDFASDHPQFALTVAGGERVRLDQPAARRADPTALTFGHDLHLRSDLRSPGGPVQLDCFACHTPLPQTGELAPIEYERHCQRCHRLSFDPRPGAADAPHESPEVVHAFLLRTFAERPEGRQSLPERRRLLPGRAGQPAPPVLRLDQRVLRQVVEAEVNLYRGSCARCHQVDLDTVLPPVTPPAIPERWLGFARFSHQRHRQVECTLCHAGAAESAVTADVLLPGIAVCRNCHGPQPHATGTSAGATTSCLSCHYYHDKSRTGAWGKELPSGIWETGSGLARGASGSVTGGE